MSSPLLFDIGAHIGNYASSNSHLYQKMVLVEANPNLCHLLRQKFPTHCVENCIAGNDKDATFWISPLNVVSTCSERWRTDSRFTGCIWEKCEDKIPVTSIDELVEKYGKPTYIKIDTEGYELAVVKSMTSAHTDNLAFEWAEELLDELLETLVYLKNLGYTRFYCQYEDNYTFTVPEDWKTFKQIIFQLSHECDPKRRTLWGMIHVSK